MVGAGIVGAAVAHELALRGVAVTLLDRGAVSSGTTGLGEGNVLCSDKDAGPELDLARAGLELYGELDARMGDIARIRRKGALIVHPEPDTWAGEAARLERMAIPGARLVDADELRALEPELTGPVCGASLFPADLQCDPRAIARELAREAALAGATVRERCAVDAITREPATGGDTAGAPVRVGATGAGGGAIAGAAAADRGAVTGVRLVEASWSRRAPSCSPPGRGARRSPRARAFRCRWSRARGSSYGWPRRRRA